MASSDPRTVERIEEFQDEYQDEYQDEEEKLSQNYDADLREMYAFIKINQTGALNGVNFQALNLLIPTNRN